MNMSDISCFLTVAKCGSFTKASEELYMSQQAVSLHIKHLESTYNVILFERKPKLKLTAEGEILLSAATDILQREAQLVDDLTVAQENYIGELTIGMPANRSTAFACEFVPFFSTLYPNVSINLQELYSSSLSTAILNNQLDLALSLISDTSPKLDTSLLHTTLLESETLYVVISDKLLKEVFFDQFPQCKLEFRKGVSLYQFAHLPMFLHPDNSVFHRELYNAMLRRGIEPFIRIKTALTSSLVELCASGYGIFFTPSMMLKYMYETQFEYFDSLNAFPVLEYQNARKTFLIYHKQKRLSKPMQDAIDIIKKIYAEHKNFDAERNKRIASL